VAKESAIKAWRKIKKSEHSKIMEALPLFITSKGWKDKQFIPHPATWLNAKRWDDEMLPEPSTENVLSEIYKDELERIDYETSRGNSYNRTASQSLPSLH
jgi:hypothetical protein